MYIKGIRIDVIAHPFFIPEMYSVNNLQKNDNKKRLDRRGFSAILR